MNDAPILSDDDPYSMPSMPTMHGGDPDALGRIDHYDLLRKLGGGGFGVVYLARDTASGVEVAIKTLHPLIKRNAEEMDLLREKFALVSRLAHPNIATALVLHPVRDIHVWDDAARAELKLSPGDSVMVMRYAPGVTLSRWRRQFPDGVVPPDLALEIGRQVAAALDYAHGERIVHRDIKPGNIMVETLGGASRPGEPQSPDAAARRDASPHRIRARILDFGLAAEIRSSMSRVSTEQGDTSGTRPYMAPEQWLGKKQDGRTDQYALACVLYELLSGAPPFAGVFETGDPMIMMATVKGEEPEEIEDAAPAVNAAILHALAKAPKDRFPSCTAFVAALTSTTEDPKSGNESTPHSSSAPNRAIRPVKSAIGNVCPTCSANNPKDARYCEACGTPLFRTCPECGKESASRVKFCSGCGTDMDGFATFKELVDKTESAAQIQDWPAIIEGAKSVPANIRLPGSTGKKLQSALAEYLQKAKETLAQSQVLDEDAEKAMAEGHFEQAINFAKTSQSLYPKCKANAEFVNLAQRQIDLTKQWFDAASREDSNLIREVLEKMKDSGMPDNPLANYSERTKEWLAVYQVLVSAQAAASDKQWAKTISICEEFSSHVHKEWSENIVIRKKLDLLRHSADANLSDLLQTLDRRLEVAASSNDDKQSRLLLEEMKKAGMNERDLERNRLRVQDRFACSAVLVRMRESFSNEDWGTVLQIGDSVPELHDKTWEPLKTVCTQISSLRESAASNLENRNREEESRKYLVELTRLMELGNYDGAFQHSLETIKNNAYAKSLAQEKMAWVCNAIEINNLVSKHSAENDFGAAEYYLKQLAKRFGLSAQTLQAREGLLSLKKYERRKEELNPGSEMSIQLPGGETMTFCWCPATTDLSWCDISGGHSFFTHYENPKKGERQVRLTNGFWIGKTPVTQRQWESVMGKNPSSFKKGGGVFSRGGDTLPDNPVDSVSFADCAAFLAKLVRPQGSSFVVRLPTVAEWEYACRAGCKADGMLLPTGSTSTQEINECAWHRDNSSRTTMPVGKKKKNAWGIHDMLGNIWEWCCDSSDRFPEGDCITDPVCIASGARKRTAKGGSFRTLSEFLCPSLTELFPRTLCDEEVGFRVLIGPRIVTPKK